MDRPKTKPTNSTIAAVFLLLTVLSAPPALAQFGMGMQMMKYFSPFGEGFNPGAIKRIDGAIKRVKTSQGRTGPMSIPNVIIVIATEEGTEYEIKLGPVWYIQSMGFRFRKGDRITVTGSLSQADGKQRILCQTIEKEGKVTTYRNAMGIPVWSPMGKQLGGSKKKNSPDSRMSGGLPSMMMQMMQGGGGSKSAADPSKNRSGQASASEKNKAQPEGGMQNMMMQMMQQMMQQRMGGTGGQGGGMPPQGGGGNFGGGFGRGFGSGGGQESGDRSVNTEVEEDVDTHHQDLE